MTIVILIGDNGQKIGEMTLQEAQRRASEQNNDLILLNQKGPRAVYKIGDAGKLKYDQKQKKKIQKVNQKSQKIKEIQMRPTIDTNDLEIKLRRVRGFLSSGIKTKLVMKFARRQLAYRDSGMRKMVDVIEQLVSEGLASVDSPPKFEGRNINVFLTPKI